MEKINYFNLPRAVGSINDKLNNVQWYLHRIDMMNRVSVYPRAGRLSSIRELSGFLQCHYSSAQRLLRDKQIMHTYQSRSITIYITDILEAAAKSERVRFFLNRIVERAKAAKALPEPPKNPQPPRILIETELYPDRFIFATIKYQGWRCNAYIPYHLCNQPDKVTDFVEQILLNRHAKHPFSIPPEISNQ